MERITIDAENLEVLESILRLVDVAKAAGQNVRLVSVERLTPLRAVGTERSGYPKAVKDR